MYTVTVEQNSVVGGLKRNKSTKQHSCQYSLNLSPSKCQSPSKRSQQSHSCSCPDCQGGSCGSYNSAQTIVSKPVAVDKLLDEVNCLKRLSDSLNQCSCEAMQEACAAWWSMSAEFFFLHTLYAREGEEDDDANQVSKLICRSQVMLVATVGLIAAITVLPTEKSPQQLNTLQKAVYCGYITEVLLCQLVLSKVSDTFRTTNPFALQLAQIVSETGLRDLQPEQETQQMISFMSKQLQIHQTLLQQICLQSSLPDCFADLISNSDQYDFVQAKTLVCEQVHKCQEDESVGMQTSKEFNSRTGKVSDLSRVTEEYGSELCVSEAVDEVEWPEQCYSEVDQNVEVPYLREKSRKAYTLVLDLDETLIHFSEQS